MARGDHLGEFELIVLAAVLRAGDDAYGVVVHREIESRTGRTAAIGSVYKALERLKKKGLVESRLGDPTPIRGGRAKQHFVVTGAGRQALQTTVETLGRMLDGLDVQWGPA
jgi:DNA-binding PadR family transcriptional regulator